ncbi:MAG: protease modulator HflC [Bacilli bacterium]|nr:protease modulator HflC [Bacilli bacterium]MBQ8218700.1 protease modulator HflC [Bacilli bacterium]
MSDKREISSIKKIVVRSIIGIVAFLALITVLSSFYSVPYNSYMIITKFGKISSVETDPGLHVKIPFIENTLEIYAGDRVYDLPTSDVITKDKKSMIANNYVIWKVTDATKYYQTLGGIDARAEERIDAAVYNATKNTISSMTQDEVIAARGEQLTTIITEASNKDITEYGIEIIKAEIKSLDLPDDNKSAVYDRMISERQNIAAGYTAQGNADAQVIRNQTDREVAVILANADKEAETIIAEGEAEYMRILADAYNDPNKAEFYTYIRSLDALKASLSGTNKTIILDKDSELAQILYGNIE